MAPHFRAHTPAAARRAIGGLAMLVGMAACVASKTSARLDDPHASFSNADPGAAAAAIDVMDADYGDQARDTVLHDELTPAAVATPEDSARADVLLVAMRGALRRYTDMQLAAADGFEELPSAMGKRTIHQLTNWSWARQEASRFDATKPTALIYREGTDGAMSLLGALYTAPASATPAELNGRIPTGPTVIVFEGGREVGRQTGAVPQRALVELLGRAHVS